MKHISFVTKDSYQQYFRKAYLDPENITEIQRKQYK